MDFESNFTTNGLQFGPKIGSTVNFLSALLLIVLFPAVSLGEMFSESKIDSLILYNNIKYPYSTVVKVNGDCSGILVAPRVVLTAVHCVPNNIYAGYINGKSVDKAKVIKRWRGGDKGYDERARWTELRGGTPDDWVLVVLDKPLGEKYGYLKLSSTYLSGSVRSVGYPFFRIPRNGRWYHGADTAFIDPACGLDFVPRIYGQYRGLYGTSCFAYSGSSGGPIMSCDSESENPEECVVKAVVVVNDNLDEKKWFTFAGVVAVSDEMRDALDQIEKDLTADLF